ncbi:unnamed protein product [Prunus armeniaca]|uniref:Uncharacterized protein n=1 Tax=Prunus armeniaca TaxID=36596 RepID=A0A6J5VNG8_PRUAR|nr:unnamed protein product [Prunus armeniaca]
MVSHQQGADRQIIVSLWHPAANFYQDTNALLQALCKRKTRGARMSPCRKHQNFQGAPRFSFQLPLRKQQGAMQQKRLKILQLCRSKPACQAFTLCQRPKHKLPSRRTRPALRGSDTENQRKPPLPNKESEGLTPNLPRGDKYQIYISPAPNQPKTPKRTFTSCRRELTVQSAFETLSPTKRKGSTESRTNYKNQNPHPRATEPRGPDLWLYLSINEGSASGSKLNPFSPWPNQDPVRGSHKPPS